MLAVALYPSLFRREPACGACRKMCLSAIEVTTIFFLLKHTKGSREAAFDDLCILADVSGGHAPSGISVPG